MRCTPGDAKFWEVYDRLERGEEAPDTGSLAALIAKYRRSPEWAGLKDATRRDYNRYLDILDERLGRFPAQAITPAVALELRDSFAATPTTANHMVSILRTLYAYGVPRGYGKANPASDIRPLKTASAGTKAWPQWALDLAMGKARPEAAMFVTLGLYTGQRSADILAMTAGCIEGDFITVRQSKTGKPLAIPMHRDLKKVLKGRKGALIPGPDGAPLDGGRWRALWTREMAKAELGKIRKAGLTPHGLRHSAVARMREAGCAVEEIMAITGHSRQMVEHYARGADQKRMARRAIAKLEKSR